MGQLAAAEAHFSVCMIGPTIEKLKIKPSINTGNHPTALESRLRVM